MPVSVSPHANRLGRLSSLLDRYVHALEEKQLPSDAQKRAAIADRDIRTVDILLRCEERLQAMMAPSKPADGEDRASGIEKDKDIIAALERRLDQRLAAERANGGTEKPE